MTINIANLGITVDTSQLSAAKGSIDDLMNSVGNAVPGFQDLSQIAGTVSTALKGVGSAAAGAVVGIAAMTAALGGLGIAMAFQWNSKIDELSDLGEAYGYTALEIQVMQRAAEDAGSSLDALLGVQQRVAMAMNKADKENSKAAEAFKHFGVETENASGKLRGQQEVMDEVMEKFNASEKSATDLAAAQIILGANARELAKAHEAAAEALKFANDLHKEGIGISLDAKQAASDNEKANAQLSAIMTVVGSNLVAIVIPAFTELTKWFVESYRTGGLVKLAFDVIEIGAWVIMQPIKAVISLFISLDSVARMAANSIRGVASAMGAALSGDFAGAGKILSETGDKNSEIEAKGNKSLETLWKDNWNKSPFGKKGGIETPSDRKNKEDLPLPGGGGGRKGGSSGGGENLTEEQKQQKKVEEDYYKLSVEIAKVTMSKADALNMEAEAYAKKYPLAQKDWVLANNALRLQKEVAIEDKKTKDMTESLANATEDYITTKQNEIKASVMGTRAAKDYLEIKKIEMDFAKKYRDVKREDFATEESYLKRIVALREAEADAIKAAKNAQEERKKSEQDWQGGARKAMDKYIEDAQNTAKLAEDAFTRSFGAMEDAMVEFVMTGKFNFKDLLKTMLAEIARFLAKQAVSSFIKVISGLVGGGSFGTTGGTEAGIMTNGVADLTGGVASANGNAFNNGSLMAFAAGGVVSRPSLFPMANGGTGLAGEAGPEAILPLARGPSGKLGVIAQQNGGGGGLTINNNIQVKVEGSGKGNEQDEQQGNKIAKAITNEIKTLIKTEVMDYMRPGNMLNRSSAVQAFA